MILDWRGFGVGAALGFTGDGVAIRSPYGLSPGYLTFQEREFNREAANAWGAGVRYDFDTSTLVSLRVPGLSVLLRYAEGADAVDPTTDRSLPTAREGDLDVIWNVPRLKGFQARFRNAYVYDGGRRIIQAFRVVLDCELPLF